ncbi:sodium/potassium-transporting ATPase subunit beta-2a isoform X3 [Tachysurus fulvidraco]|uniref:sodium/potassium-transporting ATPase subunit beta-2a isoform X3 n=1 Tax=Tachysurus fulvidraco TaxID=1234273 RepID=UPI000F507FFE|nr:sodium/potassium-transporting ATPase subunit beta-2a isoform X3 [Tachysurus fulvidraco]
MSSKQEEKKESGGWKEFFWNPRTREMLGRTASSWGLILLFYMIFYTFLAGMFCLTMYVMLLTLDDYNPTWKDRLSTPAYNDSQQVLNNDACTPNQYYIQEDSGNVRNNPKRSCQFNRTMLEECSGLSDHTYGYRLGEPCVLIKLNRVIGMLPGKDGQSPYVTCGAKKESSDPLGGVTYFPPNGTFNLMYYPYYGQRAQVNYTQPLVAVKFVNVTQNIDVNIECKINSNTITEFSERDKFAGRVSFKLRINSD